jgi:3-oxoacyl-[acyl-carrier protein] reductase
MAKVALITGGSRGIGRGIAITLGRHGWVIAISYHSNTAAAADTINALQVEGIESLLINADVSDGPSRDLLVNATLERFGRIDMLVNNAGMAPRQRVDILDIGEASYDEVMATNLKGPFFLSQRVAKEMLKLITSGVTENGVYKPVIVNIGSISAYTSSINRAEYCLSKAGVAMMTSLYADRLAQDGINVFEIRPGIIDTDMTSVARAKYDKLLGEGLTPIRRWGTPEDVGLAVLAIAEERFPLSTGETINVDGGFHLRRL